MRKPFVASPAWIEARRLAGLALRQTRDLKWLMERTNKDGPIPPHRPELGPCWMWTEGLDKDGYGRFGTRLPAPDGSKPYRKTLAHRHSWVLHFGVIPPGILVCHHCDVPGCVRPTHLFLGTHSENQLDSSAKGRSRVSQLRGEAHHMVKITKLQAVRIKEMIRDGFRSCEIAEETGAHYATVLRIRHGATWGWLQI